MEQFVASYPTSAQNSAKLNSSLARLKSLKKVADELPKLEDNSAHRENDFGLEENISLDLVSL